MTNAQNFKTGLLVALSIAASLPGASFAQTGAPTNIAPLPRASDLFSGRDAPGAYTLTWKKLPPVDVCAPVVVVDEKTLGADAYTWDSDKGTITFATPVKPASMVHVTFGYDPASSEKNIAPASAPVTVPLLQASGAQLQLTALSGAKDAKTNDALLVWKLSGAPMNALGGAITTQALLAPDLQPAKGTDSGLWERTGLNVGYRMGTNVSGIEARYSRSGTAFAPVAGKPMGLGDAAGESRFLGARYAVAPWLRAEWKQDAAHGAGDKATDTLKETLTARLGDAKGNAPVLDFARTEETRTDAKGNATGTVQNKLDLAAKVGVASLTVNTAQSEALGTAKKPGEEKTELAVTVKAQSTDKTQAATLALRDSSTQTGTDTGAKTGVSVSLQPSPSVTLTAEQLQESRTTTVKGAEQTVQKEQVSAGASIALAPGASLVGGVTQNTLNGDSSQSTQVTAKIGAGRAVELAQSLVSRTGGNAEAALESSDTRLSVRPLRGVTLFGALISNPQENGHVIETKRQEMGLAARLGAMELDGGYALTENASDDGLQTGEFTVSLGYRFSRYTRLDSAYKDGLLWGDTDAVTDAARGLRVFSFGVTHDLGTAFNLSLGGKMAQSKADASVPDDYKAEAKLGIKF